MNEAHIEELNEIYYQHTRLLHNSPIRGFTLYLANDDLGGESD